MGSRRITVLDIGGGLSANYHGDDVSPTYARLAQLLREVRGAEEQGLLNECERAQVLRVLTPMCCLLAHLSRPCPSYSRTPRGAS